MKRIFDLIISILLLACFFPVIGLALMAVFLSDWSNPLYSALRVGKNGKDFQMYKIRSMIRNAESSGVDSTAENDSRITLIGSVIRRFKIDELSQLINVMIGNMSLVGPRPNVKKAVAEYSKDEQLILEVQPGITDLSSIVFNDEGRILSGSLDPDLEYDQTIRPWKSRLAIIYVNNNTVALDCKILLLTMISFFNKSLALSLLVKEISKYTNDELLLRVCAREELKPPKGNPPGKLIVD
jgi:lipopolysaccharide/colanic/teichoic acid biosynthesis glycosyltransferase